MLISFPRSAADERLEQAGAPWLGWQRAVLHDLIDPGGAVLELEAGRIWLTTTLAARAGWVTAIADDPEALAHLREMVCHSGWPNVTLAPVLTTAQASGPFDAVVAPWLSSDLSHLRWLCRLAERRVILTGPLDDAALDQLRTSAQALGLDVALHASKHGPDGRHAVLAIDLP